MNPFSIDEPVQLKPGIDHEAANQVMQVIETRDTRVMCLYTRTDGSQKAQVWQADELELVP